MKFSIIIPTYNRATELTRCLESLMMQTTKDFEVIVCDDGSTDETSKVVDTYTRSLNIHYIKQENWGGPAKPRNSGIKVSRGEWICFLDADDWWTGDKLEEVNKHLQKGDIIYHDLTVVSNESGAKMGIVKSRKLEKPVLEDLLIGTNAIANSSCCVKRELLIQVDGLTEKRELIGVEDNDLWLKIAKVSNKFYYVEKNLGYYSVGTDNLTSGNEKQIARLVYLYNEHIGELIHGKRKQAKYALKYLTGRIHYGMKHYEDAYRSFKEGIKSKRIAIKCKSAFFLINCFFKKHNN